MISGAGHRIQGAASWHAVLLEGRLGKADATPGSDDDTFCYLNKKFRPCWRGLYSHGLINCKSVLSGANPSKESAFFLPACFIRLPAALCLCRSADLFQKKLLFHFSIP